MLIFNIFNFIISSTIYNIILLLLLAYISSLPLLLLLELTLSPFLSSLFGIIIYYLGYFINSSVYFSVIISAQLLLFFDYCYYYYFYLNLLSLLSLLLMGYPYYHYYYLIILIIHCHYVKCLYIEFYLSHIILTLNSILTYWFEVVNSESSVLKFYLFALVFKRMTCNLFCLNNINMTCLLY